MMLDNDDNNSGSDPKPIDILQAKVPITGTSFTECTRFSGIVSH